MSDGALSVGELEGQYPLCCKAMRILVRDGVTLNQARRRDPALMAQTPSRF
jgi:hypothetical protein